MYEDILRQMRESIDRRDHILTEHVQEQLDERHLTFYDIERAVKTGRIVERQWDVDWHEYKYVIRGRAYNVSNVEVAAKLTRTRRRIVVLTIYEVYKR